MSLFTFPDPVNEKAARAVAAQVLLAGAVTLALGLAVGTAWLWVTAALAAGFLARVLTGPSLSPFGQLATRVLAPRLGPARPVPGTPKRFAQGIGLAVTAAATVLLATGQPVATEALLGVLLVAAGLEAVVGFCLGCRLFAVLVRAGLVPASACADCADISRRTAPASAPVSSA